MKYKWIKREQKKINKIIRGLNKNLEKDELWLGRFYVHQNCVRSYETYPDGSGGTLHIEVSVHDRETGKNRVFYTDNYGCRYALWYNVNDFIIADVDVWSEHPKVGYTKNYQGLHY